MPQVISESWVTANEEAPRQRASQTDLDLFGLYQTPYAVCDECDCLVHSHQALETHLGGDAHKKAQSPLAWDANARHPTLAKHFPFLCKICRVRVKSQEALQTHQAAKEHRQRETLFLRGWQDNFFTSVSKVAAASPDLLRLRDGRALLAIHEQVTKDQLKAYKSRPRLDAE